MGATTSPALIKLHHDILDGLRRCLSRGQGMALDRFLHDRTGDEMFLMRVRLNALTSERFASLVRKLTHSSNQKLRSYLAVFVAATHEQYFFTRTASNVKVLDTAADGEVERYTNILENDDGSPSGLLSVMMVDNQFKTVAKAVESWGVAKEITDNDTFDDVYSIATIGEPERYDQSKQKVTEPEQGSVGEVAKNMTHAQASSALSLRRRLFGEARVAQEIYGMVLNNLFQEVYLPGVLVPSQYVDYDGKGHFASVDFCIEKPAIFRQIHPKLYEEYKERYWTQNTWKIEHGSVGYTVYFLELVPQEEYKSIRYMYLAFTTEDSFEAQSYFLIYDAELDLLDSLEKHDEEIAAITRTMFDDWFWKFDRVSALNLHHLTLDFTNAFSVDGDFLGILLALGVQAFAYGAPELDILAPTDNSKKQIMSIFSFVNGGRGL